MQISELIFLLVKLTVLLDYDAQFDLNSGNEEAVTPQLHLCFDLPHRCAILHELSFGAREGHVVQIPPIGLRFVLLLGMETKANRYLCFTGDCV